MTTSTARLRLLLVLPTALCSLSTQAGSQPPRSPYAVGGQGFATLQDAVDAIGAGEGTVVVANGRHRDCAVQEAGRITVRGETGGEAIFDGGACEGKATLVLRGAGATVEDLVFQNIQVDDGNGAGIRLEAGPLDVARVWFRDSQQGILSGSDTGAVTLTRSTFTRLGDNNGGPSHSVYFNHIPSLTITNCRFEEGRGGHYVKSWAAKVRIEDNSFDDAGGKWSNYMIDLPGGGAGRITGNVFVQGADKENHSTFVAVNAEEPGPADLLVANNEASLAPAVEWSTVFVANWGDGDGVRLEGNALGKGIKAFERR